MTLISIFDPDPLDNIGEILFVNPDKCIFIGESPILSKAERRKIDHAHSVRLLNCKAH